MPSSCLRRACVILHGRRLPFRECHACAGRLHCLAAGRERARANERTGCHQYTQQYTSVRQRRASSTSAMCHQCTSGVQHTHTPHQYTSVQQWCTIAVRSTLTRMPARTHSHTAYAFTTTASRQLCAHATTYPSPAYACGRAVAETHGRPKLPECVASHTGALVLRIKQQARCPGLPIVLSPCPCSMSGCAMCGCLLRPERNPPLFFFSGLPAPAACKRCTSSTRTSSSSTRTRTSTTSSPAAAPEVAVAVAVAA